MNNLTELFNSWHIIRWMGFMAFFFFTMSLAYGMLGRFKKFKKKKALFNWIHISSSWAGVLTVLVHMLTLLINHYQPYKVVEIFIPFASHYMRVASALGIIAFFLVLLVVFTSDVLMSKLKRTTWKTIHVLVFPSWLFMLAHSIWMGTDTRTWWGLAVYLGATAIVLTLFAFYLWEHRKHTVSVRG